MSHLFLSIGGARPQWMQHNLPWLAVLAMVLGVWRDDLEASDEPGLDG